MSNWERVALDTVESLFAGLTNEGILRAELRRLFRWLKDKDITTIITAEQGRGNAVWLGRNQLLRLPISRRSVRNILKESIRIISVQGE